MQIVVNNWLSDKVPLERGVRQGDPLSPLLYVLGVEVLPSLIRRFPAIESFLLPVLRADRPVCARMPMTRLAKMKILGVFFGNVNAKLDNWQPKLNKLQKSLSLWRSRSLSLLGKSLIINFLGFSRFTYSLECSQCHPGFLLALMS